MSSVPRNKAIEKAVRKRVLAELRHDNELVKEYKRRKKTVSAGSAPWFWSLLFPIFLLNTWATGKHDFALFVIGLTFYTLGSALSRAASLHGRLQSSPDALVLLTIPFSDRDYARLQVRREFNDALIALFSLWALCAVPLFATGRGSFYMPHILYMPIMVWLSMVLTAAVAAAGPAVIRHWLVVNFLRLIGVIILIAPSAMPSIFADIPWQALLLSPTGWPAHALGNLHKHGYKAELTFAFVPLFFLPLLPWAIRRVTAGFRSREIALSAGGTVETETGKVQPATGSVISQSAPGAAPLVLPEDGGDPDDELDHADRDVTAEELQQIEAALRERGGVEHLRWADLGVVERIIGAWLTPRERAVVDVLEGGAPKWTRALLIAIPSAFAAVFAAFYIPVLGFFLALIITLLGAGSVFVGIAGWPGLRWLPSGGKFSPFFAVYPLGFSEMSRVMIVVNLVRCGLHLPLLAAIGALVFWLKDLAPDRGALTGTMVTALLMAMQPFLVACRIVNISSYIHYIRLKKLPLIFATLLTVALMLPGAIFMFVDPGISVLFGCGAAAVVSFSHWAFTRWLYNNGTIDLLREQVEVGQSS